MHRNLVLGVVIAMLLSLAVTGIAAAAGPVAWSYAGATGPANWGSLSPDYALCSAGKEQSPVEIPASATLNPGDLKLSYQPAPLTITNNGHAIQVDYLPKDQPNNTVELQGTPFLLQQFHIHGTSEHTLAGQRFPMELHFVHQAADGRVAVIGVLVKSGAENPAYAAVLQNMPATPGNPQTIPGATVNAGDLLPADKSYYRYNGSLTTPPCTEGLDWFLMKNPVELSQAQIDRFQKLYKDNYRPVQPLNARTFLTASAPLTPARAPAKLPVTGGAPFEVGVLLAGLGLLSAGVHLRRRSA